MFKISYSKLAQICPEMAAKVDEDRKLKTPPKAKVSISALRAIRALPKSKSQPQAAKKDKAEKKAMDAKVVKARLGNGKIRRRARLAREQRQADKLAHGAIYYFMKLAARISPDGGLALPTTAEQTNAIAKVGHFVREHQVALRNLEAKFYAGSQAATTSAEKMLAEVGVLPE
jgi:hypothetical protein